MKTRTSSNPRPFKLEIFTYGNSYYIDRVAELEKALARKPKRLQLDLVGVGEISADAALRIRAALLARAPKTQIITHAHSSLQNGSVLVWLLGDQRLIRDDATVSFRRANLTGLKVADPEEAWKIETPDYADSYSDVEPEEADYARVLQLINEFLPVSELVGRIVGVPVLRQFGLVEHAQVDSFLATVFAKSASSKSKRALTPR
jgi:hypothetical protein